jgi:hypothetical protein
MIQLKHLSSNGVLAIKKKNKRKCCYGVATQECLYNLFCVIVCTDGMIVKVCYIQIPVAALRSTNLLMRNHLR